MTNYVWPADPVAGAPAYAGRALRETMSALIAGATAARPLGARSGVRPGTSTTTVTATSAVWTVGPVAGIMDVETAAEAGPYAFACNANQTGAVTAADAVNPRVDIVYIRLDDPAESDGSATPLVVAGYLAGVPAATPAAPAAPARCMVLANINVPLSGGGAPTVTWNAPYAVAAGAPVPVWSQAERDALTLHDGKQVYRLDLHLVETYNATTALWMGGAWTACSPGLGSSGVAPAGFVNNGFYTQTGKKIDGESLLVWGATPTVGTGFYVINMPVVPNLHGVTQLRVGTATLMKASTGAVVFADLVMFNASQAEMVYSTGTVTTGGVYGATLPWVPAVNDGVYIRFSYEGV
jgi:hypothetical protein